MLGRRRSFDKDKMLDNLMNVFWRHGYAGTSMSHLTDETGLTKPSLYAAYGNKEDMYCAALGSYLQLQSEEVYAKLADDGRSLAETLSDFLNATAKGATRPGRPKGCFIAGASCDAQADLLPEKALAQITQINEMGNDMLAEVLRVHLGANADRDAEILANYILVLQNGLVQLAIRGADSAALEATANVAMEGLNALLSSRIHSS